MRMMLTFMFPIVLSFSVTAFAQEYHLMGAGFTAPSVYGSSNLQNQVPGDIILDTSSGTFVGYTGSAWVPLGGAAQTVPSGTISAYAGSSVPSGYLFCDGSAVSRTAYSTLFLAIGTMYGSGDGTTTFNLPNTQGVFLRGAGSQIIDSITYTASQGTSQGDQMQGHYHSVLTEAGAATNAPNNYIQAKAPVEQQGTNYTGSPTNDGTNYCGFTRTEYLPYSCRLPLFHGKSGYFLAKLWPEMFSEVALVAFND